MSPHKEPLHFNTGEAWITTPDRRDYEKLFKGASERHIAVGEASTWYLYSMTAVANIEAYVSDARYIVCLRNPVEMAYSLHEQQIVCGNEHIEDFERAWKLVGS
ncbi:MAG: sulfotransferase, partial [Gammaproteobacteria bacterium]